MENQQLQVVQKQVKGMQEMVEKTIVATDEDLALVSDRIKQVKKLGAYAEEQKEKYTAPAKAIIAEAKRIYDPAIQECKMAENALKMKALMYTRERDAKIKKEADKIAADLESGKIKKQETATRKLAALPDVKSTVSGATSSLQVSKRAVAKIVDRDKIPDEFWVIDEVAVRREALIRNKEGKEQIPGVEIIIEESMSSR